MIIKGTSVGVIKERILRGQVKPMQMIWAHEQCPTSVLVYWIAQIE